MGCSDGRGVGSEGDWVGTSVGSSVGLVPRHWQMISEKTIFVYLSDRSYSEGKKCYYK